jgi:DNA mismatch repair protein MutH
MIFGQHKHFGSTGGSKAQVEQESCAEESAVSSLGIKISGSGLETQYHEVDPGAGYHMVTWEVMGVEYYLMGNIPKEEMYKVAVGLV